MSSGTWSFVHSAREVVSGAGCLVRAAERAKTEGRRRPALVLDPWFETSPLARDLAQRLEEACGAAPAIHVVSAGEPDLVVVEEVRAALAAASPDAVIVLGGGSAIDAAKVGRILLANPGPPEAIAGAAGMPMRPHESLFVAIPTTAGTGSEVSESAVIAVAGSDYKAIFRSPEMTPHLALLDPVPCTSAPASVTAASGLDAVTHAVEAFWSKAANPVTDMLAREAMRCLADGLPHSFDTPGDLAAREACLVGSMLAAMAFNSAHLGLAHAVAGALGNLHHVAHGIGNALALPHVAAFNQDTTPAKAAEVAGIFGGETAASALFALRARLGLDVSLDTLVPPDALDGVAAGAMRSGQLRVNPRAASQAEIRDLLERMRTPGPA